MSKKVEDIFLTSNLTGAVEIDVDLAVKKWNHLYFVTEWNNRDWRFKKMLRKDSKIAYRNVTISEAQAKELISKLNLKPVQSVFKNGITWKK